MKLTVTQNGKLIGKRTTDRPYTHVVALTKFDAAAARRACAHSWETQGARSCKNSIPYHREMATIGAGGTVHVTGCIRPWSYQQSQQDYENHVKWLDGLSDDAILGREAAAHFGRCEKWINEKLAKGDEVLSWHSSLALAEKARSAAIQYHPAHILKIFLVDA